MKPTTLYQPTNIVNSMCPTKWKVVNGKRIEMHLVTLEDMTAARYVFVEGTLFGYTFDEGSADLIFDDACKKAEKRKV